MPDPRPLTSQEVQAWAAEGKVEALMVGIPRALQFDPSPERAVVLAQMADQLEELCEFLISARVKTSGQLAPAHLLILQARDMAGAQ